MPFPSFSWRKWPEHTACATYRGLSGIHNRELRNRDRAIAPAPSVVRLAVVDSRSAVKMWKSVSWRLFAG
jgi:hypothetical protein